MPQINRGVKFDSSTSTPAVASVASLSNAALQNADFLAGNNGAVVWTMTPALRQTPGVVMLIEGNKLDIGIEYDNANQVRMFAKTATDTFVSNWVAAGAEHTFGVSYQTPQTMPTSTLVLSINGNNKKEIGVNLAADAAGPGNRDIVPLGNFDGLLSQVAVFNDALSDAEIKTMTGDASYMANALSKLAPSATVSGVTNTPTLGAGTGGAGATKITLGGSYNVGDTVSITYKGLTASYTLTATDKPTGSTDPMMRTVLTNKLAAAISAQFPLGSYTISKDTTGTPFINFLEINATSAPQPLVTFTNTKNFRESALDVYVNLGASTLTYSTTQDATLNTIKVVTANNGDVLSFYDTAPYTGSSTKLKPAAENGVVTAAPEATVLQSLPTSGPFFAELSSYTPGANAGDGGIAKYQVFIDPAQDTVTPNSVKSMGLTVQLDSASGTLNNLASLAPTSLNSISNINKVGNAATMQWFTQHPTGLTDYKQAIAEVTVQLPTLSAGQQPAPSINLTFSDMSLDGKNFTSTTGPLPLATVEAVQSQVYSVTGSVKQYTSDATSGVANGTAATFGPNGGGIKGASVFYQVYDDASKAPAKMTVAMPVLSNGKVVATPTSPDGDVRINLIVQKPSAVPGVTGYSMAIELPSNNVPNSNVAASFTPLVNGTAFGAPTVRVEGRMLTISGTFTATSAVDTDFALGTINLKLSNMYGKTETVGFNKVNFTTAAGNFPSTGRDVSFGVVQTDATGQYRIDNLPKGQIFPAVIDTVDKQALVGSSPLISTEDAYKVLLMAAGRKNGANDWLPSDFIAADYNRDGVVTAEDALNLLNYSVLVSPTKAAPAMAFFSYDSNTLGMTKSNVFTPNLDNTYTYQDLTADATQSTFDGTGKGPVMDFVGVLIGDVAH